MSRSRSRRKRSSGRRSPNNDTNANHDSANNDNANNDSASNGDNGPPRANRFTTETKKATKTTELMVYVVAVVGVVMTALQVDEDPNFGAEQAWLYVTILTVGYMISRGLAKSGSHEPAASKRTR